MCSPPPPPKPCPICGKPAIERFRPFCSKRCADVDLHRWLSGAYAVPVAGADEQSDEIEHGSRNGGGSSSGTGD